jgi:glycosidase
LVDIARFWMDEAGVDGYRLDGAQHLVENESSMANTDETKAWLTTFHSMLHETHPKALLVGEIWSPSTESRQYVPGQVDLAFDFDAAEAAARVAAGGSARGLADASDLFLGGYPDGQVGIFTDNHDKTRLATTADRDMARLTLIAAWQLTQRGVPFLYYGQEIALRGDKPDERIRTPMPWTDDAERGGFTSGTPWQNFQFGHGETGPNAMNVAAQANDPKSLLSTYRTLIALRNDSAAIRAGSVGSVDAGSFDVIAYTRTDGSDTVLVIMNATGEPVSDYGISGNIGKAGGWKTVLGRADRMPDSAEPQGFKPVDTLQPWETVILRSMG